MAEPNLAWGGFSNGRIPRENLVDFYNGKLLQADAAANLSKLRAAFKARWGADLYPDWYQDLYRDIARQQDMWNHRGDGFPWPNSVASPGHSIHGWARSADLTGYGSGGSARHNWLVAAAPNYGWSWNYGRQLGESWHFDYVGPITTTAGDTIEPLPPAPDYVEDIMYNYVYNTVTGNWWLADYGRRTLTEIQNSDDNGKQVAYALAGPSRDLTTQQYFDNWRQWTLDTFAAMNARDGASGGFTAGDRTTLEDIASKGELTQALTSTVSLVNEHADANKDEILQAIDEIPAGSGGGSGTSAYSLSLDIDNVPGTATGTATPQ